MLGLLIDVIGAFLLSAEAIKVENLQKLSDRFLRPLLASFVVYIHELFTPIDTRQWPRLTTVGRRGLAAFGICGWVIALPIAVIVIRVYGVNAWSLFWAVSVLALVPMTVILSVHFSIRIVSLIDRYTPSGGVGILGFLLLLTGFSLQFYGTYLTL
jgi:hypothetical protein